MAAILEILDLMKGIIVKMIPLWVDYNPQIDEEHNGSKNGLGDFEYHQKGFDLQ
ncbi:11767_t:CDS:2, partial [Entrophospora sp. SA101]